MPLTNLPGPIGQLATNFVTAVQNGVSNLLAALPTPVTPTPFGSTNMNVNVARRADTTATAAVTSLPEPSLAVPGGITLKKFETAEKIDTTEDLGDPGTVDAGPKVDAPIADPPSDPEPLTNVVRSSNKVKPGRQVREQGRDRRRDRERRRERESVDRDRGSRDRCCRRHDEGRCSRRG